MLARQAVTSNAVDPARATATRGGTRRENARAELGSKLVRG